MIKSFRNHFPKYFMEAIDLGIFMISAAFFLTFFEVFWAHLIPSVLLRLFLEGIAIGFTAITLIYFSWEKQSAAHFNPVVTLTFWHLGKVHPSYFVFYVTFFTTNIPKLARYTRLFAGLWIMLFMTFEAPFSGISMNSTRSVATALPSSIWTAMWVYLIAPFVGMLFSVEFYRFVRKDVICAKLNYFNSKRCIFKRYGYASC